MLVRHKKHVPQDIARQNAPQPAPGATASAPVASAAAAAAALLRQGAEEGDGDDADDDADDRADDPAQGDEDATQPSGGLAADIAAAIGQEESASDDSQSETSDDGGASEPDVSGDAAVLPGGPTHKGRREPTAASGTRSIRRPATPRVAPPPKPPKKAARKLPAMPKPADAPGDVAADTTRPKPAGAARARDVSNFLSRVGMLFRSVRALLPTPHTRELGGGTAAGASLRDMLASQAGDGTLPPWAPIASLLSDACASGDAGTGSATAFGSDALTRRWLESICGTMDAMFASQRISPTAASDILDRIRLVCVAFPFDGRPWFALSAVGALLRRHLATPHMRVEDTRKYKNIRRRVLQVRAEGGKGQGGAPTGRWDVCQNTPPPLLPLVRRLVLLQVPTSFHALWTVAVGYTETARHR